MHRMDWMYSFVTIKITEFKDTSLSIDRSVPGKIIVPVPAEDSNMTTKYTFDLKEGENFFIVLRKKTGEEQIVVKKR